MNKGKIFRKNPAVTTRARKNEELTLLNAETAEIVILNFVAAYIWSMIDGKKTFNTIVGILHQKFPDVSIDQIKRDSEQTIEELASRRFIL